MTNTSKFDIFCGVLALIGIFIGSLVETDLTLAITLGYIVLMAIFLPVFWFAGEEND